MNARDLYRFFSVIILPDLDISSSNICRPALSPDTNHQEFIEALVWRNNALTDVADTLFAFNSAVVMGITT